MREVRKTLTNRIGKYTLQDDVRAIGKVPVRFEPGSHWLYGFGHEMVAALVEETSGMSIGCLLYTSFAAGIQACPQVVRQLIIHERTIFATTAVNRM